MILGTYRSVGMLASEHPLRTLQADLERHRRCNEVTTLFTAVPGRS